jgi:hypothetical protein
VRANVAGGQPPRIQRDDPLIEPVQPGLTLPHDPRSEAAVAVPRHLQLDAADLGQQHLAGHPVAAVARPAAGRVVLLIAEVFGHLLGQRPLQHRLRHLGQQAVRAEQLDPLRLRPGQQLIGQLLIHHRR